MRFCSNPSSLYLPPSPAPFKEVGPVTFSASQGGLGRKWVMGGVFLSGHHCPSHHPLPFAMLPCHAHILEKTNRSHQCLPPGVG